LTFQLVMRVHYSSNLRERVLGRQHHVLRRRRLDLLPLVNADVSGHEVSHGFTEQHSNLTYSGMSGGMNEAFSDMGGEATEYYWKGSNDWLVGAEIFKGSGALRYMSKPAAGRWLDRQRRATTTAASTCTTPRACTTRRSASWPPRPAGRPEGVQGASPAPTPLYWTASSTFNQGACGVEKRRPRPRLHQG
jgi:pseudolysin/vibriolysin